MSNCYKFNYQGSSRCARLTEFSPNEYLVDWLLSQEEIAAEDMQIPPDDPLAPYYSVIRVIPFLVLDCRDRRQILKSDVKEQELIFVVNQRWFGLREQETGWRSPALDFQEGMTGVYRISYEIRADNQFIPIAATNFPKSSFNLDDEELLTTDQRIERLFSHNNTLDELRDFFVFRLELADKFSHALSGSKHCLGSTSFYMNVQKSHIQQFFSLYKKFPSCTVSFKHSGTIFHRKTLAVRDQTLFSNKTSMCTLTLSCSDPTDLKALLGTVYLS